MKKKISIVTLGCAKNQSDTDNLTRLLQAKGHEVVADQSEASAIVVHTCSFIEAAKKESIDAILQVSQAKTKSQQLIVTGCLVQQHGQEIFDDLPEVDAFLGTGQLEQIPQLLEKRKKRFLDRANPGGLMDPDLDAARQKVSPPAVWRADGSRAPWAYLRLSEGCSHPCSFCVIPRLRGGVQSRKEDTILKEVHDLAAQGVEEFVIIGQDTGDWGRDVRQSREQTAESRKRLPSLLRKISQVPGVRWIRLMYMHPASFTDELLAVFAEQPETFPYLDMPFQHIDSEMLKQMQRKTDETGLRQLLTRIHQRAPKLTLRTTFIVGFPGETEAQLKSLVGFVKEGHFDYLGAFSYSQEEGTPAAKRTDQLPEDEKKARLTAVTDAYFDVAHRKGLKRIGATETIILEETEGDTILGRTSREAPEIDAVVRLPRRAAREGRFVKAKLTGYDAYEFTADPITDKTFDV